MRSCISIGVLENSGCIYPLCQDLNCPLCSTTTTSMVDVLLFIFVVAAKQLPISCFSYITLK